DMVIPIPSSGTAAAIGFANKSGIMFGEGVIQNRYIGRTFIAPDQHMRELGVQIKFGPMKAGLKGKELVVVDDSMVRGTTLRDFVKLLRKNGAKKIHMRIASPPIVGSCFYGVDTPTKEELVANKFRTKGKVDVDKIRKFLGADSLAYLSLEGLLKSAGVKMKKKKFDCQKTNFCTACLTGCYKIALTGVENKFQLEKPALTLK
ncbi:MAG: phosphoribosyltransferase family protein, partial [bacterium]|nr:phosphoribosyltransferase family protein [bacterium]